ncbi:c-di-GMP-binding flagellar brake protein YcgR, contains PilZNR and PilZ domains [Sporolituus thermophilus DSM 23256]|uniref:C-di-GMP-binding flagellar brake protein YcgR, contains PilZNR and PilZ domains n=2 Tax=Sporolituus TaxID=909931 RepID=A0A1G7KQ88_9FIRM|nr:c-di-GMP-binding flagellar brake protein YcgR, contains PilZNR and PilZ domains [Sporolituus thermophilus DSM 23256]
MLANGDKAERYSSRIEEVTDEYLIIAMPMSKGYPVFLSLGDNLHVRIVDNGTAYQFTCTLVSKKLHPLPVWVVTRPREIIKVQQRSFVRVRTALPVEISIFDNETAQFSNSFQACSRDLSGGGIQLVSKEALDLGMKVQLAFELPEAGLIVVNGEVVRIEKPHHDRDIFWIGIKFLDLAERERSKIIRYIFKKQLEDRRKGL